MEDEPPNYKFTTNPEMCLSQVDILTSYIDSTINSQSLNVLNTSQSLKVLNSLLTKIYDAEKAIGQFLKTELRDPLMRYNFKCSLKGLLGMRNRISNKSIERLGGETVQIPRLFPKD